MKNRAHTGEAREKRLKRFQVNEPAEAIDTLLNSIDNYFNNEIRETFKKHQTSLLFLGIHASALTIADALFGYQGEKGYKKFLQEFVDEASVDTQFSLIADTLHGWRNIMAHQWLGSAGHTIAYDYTMQPGWKKEDGVLVINPQIYGECYLRAFAGNGKIWDYAKSLTVAELEKAKKRIIKKYVEK
jgi:hypothetical protein